MSAIAFNGNNVLRLGLPSGSLQDATFSLLTKAGYNFSKNTRSYSPSVDDDEIQAVLIRAQEIAGYVDKGIFDAGITGKIGLWKIMQMSLKLPNWPILNSP